MCVCVCVWCLWVFFYCFYVFWCTQQKTIMVWQMLLGAGLFALGFYGYLEYGELFFGMIHSTYLMFSFFLFSLIAKLRNIKKEFWIYFCFFLPNVFSVCLFFFLWTVFWDFAYLYFNLQFLNQLPLIFIFISLSCFV